MTKKILELFVCLLHPIAVVLIWIELLQRDDIGSVRKLAWGIAVLIPLVPFLYVLLGNEFL
jgi:cobalamin biosynthesis protein CobD/CbiB